MNILVLSGSPRKGGNTDILVDAFAKGASESGHSVSVISVHDVDVHPCKGCDACFKRSDMSCIQDDDMAGIYKRLAEADMLVIASPVYFYGISSQLKAIIDRCHNPIRDTFHISRSALLLVGAASRPEMFDAIIAEYNLCISYFDIADAGQILVRRAKEKGDINKAEALEQAYNLGRGL